MTSVIEIQPALKGGYATIMDRISECLLKEFSGEHRIAHLDEEKAV